VNTLCRSSRRVWCLAALFICATVTSVRAELAEDVTQFLSDFDRLAAQRVIIATDREQMATNLNNDEELRKSVRKFFLDRAEAMTIRALKALDRKEMRITLGFKPEKLTKPSKGTGDLTQDATAYLANYDAWKLHQSLVANDISAMRMAVTNNDATALTSATTSFFTNSRLRLQKRVQWQADIRSMKKDIGFKGSGKALTPTGETLSEITSAFLADRSAWEAKQIQLDVDREAIRAAISGNGTLQDAVTKFLTTRREKAVLGRELFLDREAMRKELRGKRFKERKLGAELSAKDLDQDEEDDSLEESSDEAGE